MDPHKTQDNQPPHARYKETSSTCAFWFAYWVDSSFPKKVLVGLERSYAPSFRRVAPSAQTFCGYSAQVTCHPNFLGKPGRVVPDKSKSPGDAQRQSEQCLWVRDTTSYVAAHLVGANCPLTTSLVLPTGSTRTSTPFCPASSLAAERGVSSA